MTSVPASLRARVLSEAVGTLLLVFAVVGSGIMAERLAAPPAGSPALALLCNTLATGGALVALVLTFGPTSGAHMNPCVTLTEVVSGRMSARIAGAYVVAQVGGGILGTCLAHVEFGLPIAAGTGAARLALGTFVAEVAATAGLILVVRKVGPRGPAAAAAAVAGWIIGAYWFTSSTSFANPAVTIARAFTPTYAGILAADVPGFLLAQFIGTGFGLLIDRATETAS